jgi:hypothetical protein
VKRRKGEEGKGEQEEKEGKKRECENEVGKR